MIELLHNLLAVRKFPGYAPQPLTMAGAARWLNQFEKADRNAIRGLLNRIIYLSEKMVRKILVEQNAILMGRLADAGVPAKKLVYIQVHDAGSSSPVMLNMLRDRAGLEQRGCKFLDS